MKIIFIIFMISFGLLLLLSILIFDFNYTITGINIQLIGDRPDQKIDILYFIDLCIFVISLVVIFANSIISYDEKQK